MSEAFLDTIAAARHTGFIDDGQVNVNAFRLWVNRHGVTKHHVGRKLRFKISELEAAMTDDADPLVERALRLHAAGGKR